MRDRVSREGPVPIDAGMARVATRLGLVTPDVSASVEALWARCAGTLAELSTVRGVRDGAVHIEVADPAVRDEFRWHSEEIVARLREALRVEGHGDAAPQAIVIRTVRTRQSPVVDLPPASP